MADGGGTPPEAWTDMTSGRLDRHDSPSRRRAAGGTGADGPHRDPLGMGTSRAVVAVIILLVVIVAWVVLAV